MNNQSRQIQSAIFGQTHGPAPQLFDPSQSNQQLSPQERQLKQYEAKAKVDLEEIKRLRKHIDFLQSEHDK